MEAWKKLTPKQRAALLSLVIAVLTVVAQFVPEAAGVATFLASLLPSVISEGSKVLKPADEDKTE